MVGGREERLRFNGKAARLCCWLQAACVPQSGALSLFCRNLGLWGEAEAARIWPWLQSYFPGSPPTAHPARGPELPLVLEGAHFSRAAWEPSEISLIAMLESRCFSLLV